MNDKTTLAIVAIICITFLESIALMLGVNGIGMGVVIAAIAGLGGFSLGIEWVNRKGT